MSETIRSRLTYANVVSTLCLFVLLGGGAYAASKLPKDSVKSKQIKAGAVKNADLADNAVTSPKVADGSLQGTDFAAGQLPAGPQGDRGPAGSTSCPSGTTRLGTTALCYETAVRASTSAYVAAQTCTDNGLTLPTLSEALAISRATDHASLWSNIFYYDGAAFVGISGASNGVNSGSAGPVATSTYRCVGYASDQ